MTRRTLTFRKSDLRRAVEAVIAAGLRVVGVKVNAQGDIEVVTGDGENNPASGGGNEWDRL